MAESSGLILTTVDVSFFTAPPRAQLASVYVISYRDGSVKAFTGTPSAGDRRSSRSCYIVDTAEHRVSATYSVPSAKDAYSFTVDVEATWKVTNPEAVVRKNTANGDEVVLAHLKDEIWVTSRQFPANSPGPAEMAARTALARLRDLDEGITILRAAARFRTDSRLQDGDVAIDEDALQGTLAGNRMARLRNWFDGSEHAAILSHLLQHPDDTGSVLQLMRDDRNQKQQVHLDLLKDMLDRGFITDDDAQPLRDALLGFTQRGGALGAPALGSSATGSSAGAKPPLALPAHLGPVSGASSSSSGAPDPARSPASSVRDDPDGPASNSGGPGAQSGQPGAQAGGAGTQTGGAAKSGGAAAKSGGVANWRPLPRNQGQG